MKDPRYKKNEIIIVKWPGKFAAYLRLGKKNTAAPPFAKKGSLPCIHLRKALEK